MMRRIGGMMVGGQTGAAVGALAREVVSSTDVGLPLGPEGVAALLPSGVAQFGEGLSVGADEVRIFLALREAAHHRLFAHVPWLRSRLLAAVEDYARGITVDTSALRDAMPQIDPSNPEALREALADAALFQPEDTPQQKAALTRLETLLALVEGWVATVVNAAATDRLPQAGALAEAIRRRRATGGPAEQTFATLVGLELRPRRLREAAALWQQLTDGRGVAGRDAVWSHPDLLPTAEDLDDPDGFVTGRPELDMSSLEQEIEAVEADADAATPDAGTPDAGTPDAGTSDTGGPDTGGPGTGGAAPAQTTAHAAPAQTTPRPDRRPRAQTAWDAPRKTLSGRYPANRVRSVVIALRQWRRKFSVIHSPCMKYYLVASGQVAAIRGNPPPSPAISTVALRNLPRNSTVLSTTRFDCPGGPA